MYVLYLSDKFDNISIKSLGVSSLNFRSGSVNINLFGKISYTCLLLYVDIQGPLLSILFITLTSTFFKKFIVFKQVLLLFKICLNV